MARAFASVLPTPRTSLLGREQDVDALRHLLLEDGAPLVTVTGPGGVGKTRLALAVAADLEVDYDDGVAFVPLAAVRDPALVLPAIVRALGLRETPGVPLAETLAGVLRDQHLVLVLDNLEHVAASAPGLATLLERCPRLQMLATSRVRLHLSAEYLYPVPPLPVPVLDAHLSRSTVESNPAVLLFCQRTRQANPHFELTTDNASSVAAIVAHLDGLPLAIELAAARAAVLSPAALLARLDQRLRLLTGGPEDVAPRLQSMTDTIAWSYDLLSEAQQSLLRQLAVFVGGFESDAAVALVREDEIVTLDDLHALVDQSLIQQGTGDRPGIARRFTMLETVREFALEQLRESGEELQVRAAHAAGMVALAEEAHPHLLGPLERAWNDRLDAELGNLRAALAWSLAHNPEQALHILGATCIFWCWRVPVSEGRRWLTQALAGTHGDAVARSRALSSASLLANMQGDVPANESYAASAVALGEEGADQVTTGWALTHLSAGAFFLGDTARAITLLDRALPLLLLGERSIDRAWAAFSLAWRGLAAAMGGDVQRAITDYEEALRQARESGSDGIILFILDDFAGLLLEVGQLDQAYALAAEAMEIATLVNETWLVAHAVLTRASIDAAAGIGVHAAQGLGAAEAFYRAVGLTMPPPLQRRRDLAEDRARQALGIEAFEAETGYGRTNPVAVVTATLRREREQLLGPAPEPVVSFTRREADVLRLLATGKTDREIAEALFISRKTASNHVASILRKARVETRAAAAIFAVRAGLA